jgi:hypothetical protein
MRPAFTLLRFDPAVDIDGLVTAAQQRGEPTGKVFTADTSHPYLWVWALEGIGFVFRGFTIEPRVIGLSATMTL